MHTSGTGAAGCGSGPSRRSYGGGIPLKSRVFEIIAAEQARQNSTVELIASENFVSENVMKSVGSCLTNK